MFPWIWLYAPQWRLPWGGDVAQDIEPRLDLFFKGIKPWAGNPRVEARAFDVASYGDQLGVITELVLQIAAQQPAEALAPVAKPLEQLRCIHERIQRIKAEEKLRENDELAARMEKLRGRDPSV